MQLYSAAAARAARLRPPDVAVLTRRSTYFFSPSSSWKFCRKCVAVSADGKRAVIELPMRNHDPFVYTCSLVEGAQPKANRPRAALLRHLNINPRPLGIAAHAPFSSAKSGMLSDGQYHREGESSARIRACFGTLGLPVKFK